jgi:hypothetical protein
MTFLPILYNKHASSANRKKSDAPANGEVPLDAMPVVASQTTPTATKATSNKPEQDRQQK